MVSAEQGTCWVWFIVTWFKKKKELTLQASSATICLLPTNTVSSRKQAGSSTPQWTSPQRSRGKCAKIQGCKKHKLKAAIETAVVSLMSRWSTQFWHITSEVMWSNFWREIVVKAPFFSRFCGCGLATPSDESADCMNPIPFFKPSLSQSVRENLIAVATWTFLISDNFYHWVWNIVVDCDPSLAYYAFKM